MVDAAGPAHIRYQGICNLNSGVINIMIIIINKIIFTTHTHILIRAHQ